MKYEIITEPTDAKAKIDAAFNEGRVTFIYHTADPEQKLLSDKFLYVHTTAELHEKINLLETDFTARYMIR